MDKTIITALLGFMVPLMMGSASYAKDQAEIVNVDNFVRAETAAQFDRAIDMAVKMTGRSDQLTHLREPTPLDKQSVIRMNRDTLYSFMVVDISKAAILTMPDAGKRYLTVMVVNEDHYINKVFDEAGTYELTIIEFDTPYVMLTARTLVYASDTADIKAANALQDKMTFKRPSINHIDKIRLSSS